jgi:hypothetical protein
MEFLFLPITKEGRKEGRKGPFSGIASGKSIICVE